MTLKITHLGKGKQVIKMESIPVWVFFFFPPPEGWLGKLAMWIQSFQVSICEKWPKKERGGGRKPCHINWYWWFLGKKKEKHFFLFLNVYTQLHRAAYTHMYPTPTHRLSILHENCAQRGKKMLRRGFLEDMREHRESSLVEINTEIHV